MDKQKTLDPTVKALLHIIFTPGPLRQRPAMRLFHVFHLQEGLLKLCLPTVRWVMMSGKTPRLDVRGTRKMPLRSQTGEAHHVCLGECLRQPHARSKANLLKTGSQFIKKVYLPSLMAPTLSAFCTFSGTFSEMLSLVA